MPLCERAKTSVHVPLDCPPGPGPPSGASLVAQLWAKSVGAVRLRALPFFLVQQGCLRFGVSRCGVGWLLW